MIEKSLLVFSLLFSFSLAQYTTFQWSLCHNATQRPTISLYDIDTYPTPVLNPGVQTIRLKMDIQKAISGPIKANFNIIRKVSGLALPVRCYLITLSSGLSVYIGSCIYDDLCVAWQTLFNVSPGSCSPEAAPYGIDCSCPFNIPVQQIDTIGSFQIVDFSTLDPFLAIFGSGDYDIRLIASDSQQNLLGCLNFKFTMKKAI